MTRNDKSRVVVEIVVIHCRGEARLARAANSTISPKINAKTEHFLPVEACLNPTDHDINLFDQSEFALVFVIARSEHPQGVRHIRKAPSSPTAVQATWQS